MKKLKDIVKLIVERELKIESSFTSVDITLKARETHSDIRISNSDVAEILRKNVIRWSHAINILYNANLIKVSTPNGMSLCYLYFHITSNPENYLNRDQTTLKSKQRNKVKIRKG